MLCLQVQKDYKFKCILLDDREFKFSYKGVQKCEQILIDIAKILSLEEKYYFSFRYTDSNMQSQWIDLNKTIKSQFKSIYISEYHEIIIYFSVKFYIPDPCKLNHEITRYFYYIQLRKDILNGRIPVQFDFAVDLFSYFLQDELGDYNLKRDLHGYASEFNFIPNQSFELEKAAEAKHSLLKGMSQCNAEINFLNKAKWLEYYGVELQPVLDENNIEYFIGLTPTGISVYKNKLKINSYFWPRINKLNYKSNKFMLTVIDKTNDKKVHVFILNNKAASKNLWKSCVDHHRFFSLEYYELRIQIFDRIKTVYEEPAKLNTTNATSKNGRNVKNNNESNSSCFKRMPAKRIPRREADFLIDLEKSEGIKTDLKNMKLNDNIINQNGNLIFNKKSPQKSNITELENEVISYNSTFVNNKPKEKGSPPISAKSCRSFKFADSMRSELFNENDTNQQQNSGTYKQHNVIQSDSENEIKCSNNANANGVLVRRNSNSSRSSKRHHRHTPSARSSNKNENNVSRSRKSLTDQVSATNLIKNHRNDPSETCHETTMDENDENQMERKRQIRRRKRSKSPGTSKVPEEILQHINYNLIDAEGMSADQLKEIPFVKIETNAPPFRISPHRKRYKSKSPHRRKSGGDFYDSKTSIAYIRDGKAQIAKTNKLKDNTDFVNVNISDKNNSLSTGPVINSKLLYFNEHGVNIGFSADSGCEDMISRPN